MEGNFWWWIVLVITLICFLITPPLLHMLWEELVKIWRKNEDK